MACIIACLASACGQNTITETIETPEQRSARTALSQYQKQRSLALTNNNDINFELLRQAYAKSELFEPWDMTEHQAGLALLNAQEDGNLPLCLTLARALVDRNFTSLLGHHGLASCASDEHHTDLHLWILRGLLTSIEASGDGDSLESPYICNSSTEMRDFIQLKGLLMFRQENIQVGFKQIELAHTMDAETKELIMLYFDLTRSRLKSFAPAGF